MKTFKILCVAMLAVAMAACSGKTPTPAEVASRIDAHETLSEADYGVMIDYCGEYAKKVQQYFDIINAQPSDSTAEYSRAAQDMADIKAASPYLDMFRSAIYSVDSSKLGAKNLKKVKEYEKYEAFPIPDGSGPDLTVPGEVGVIEEMPDTDTSGVISQGDGIAVDNKK